ncbi:MAG: peptidoglycan-binding protein [Patescibacteria group bacterium]
MNYDLLPKSFIVAALVVIAGSFGTGVYFSQKSEHSQALTLKTEPQVAAVVAAIKTPQVTPTPILKEIPSPAPTPEATPILTPTQTPAAPSPTSKLVSTSYSPFQRFLTVGSVGDDVKTLQILLNETGFPIAASGPGSKGKETTKFGPSTAKALAQLQCDRGIMCDGAPETTGYGATNDETLEILNALYNLTRPKDYSKRTIRIKK